MGHRTATARLEQWATTGPAWRAVGCGTPSERRLLRAYRALFVVPAGDDGTRCVPLARFAAYEVRLLELTDDAPDRLPPLPVELYAHDDASTLDTCSLHELEDAVTAVDRLVARACELHARSLRPWFGRRVRSADRLGCACFRGVPGRRP
jgi:hypothetical protein